MNETKETKPRQRNVAHLWADKRVLRFFRKNLPKLDYKNIRNIYLALCEIDSDFVEERNSGTKSIHNLTKTCTTYTGMDQGIVSQGLRYLKMIGLIDYGRKTLNGKIIGSYLTMYEYDEERILSLIRENPYKVESGYIKNINRFFKNTKNVDKNSLEFENKEPEEEPEEMPKEETIDPTLNKFINKQVDFYIDRAKKHFPTVHRNREKFYKDIQKLMQIDKLTEDDLLQIQEYLAERPETSGFCWFDQIGTPGKLRKRIRGDPDGPKIWEKVLKEIRYSKSKKIKYWED